MVSALGVDAADMSWDGRCADHQRNLRGAARLGMRPGALVELRARCFAAPLPDEGSLARVTGRHRAGLVRLPFDVLVSRPVAYGH